MTIDTAELPTFENFIAKSNMLPRRLITQMEVYDEEID